MFTSFAAEVAALPSIGRSAFTATCGTLRPVQRRPWKPETPRHPEIIITGIYDEGWLLEIEAIAAT